MKWMILILNIIGLDVLVGSAGNGLICRKVLPQSSSFLISDTASDFRGLVKNSNLFVDNTLLIGEVLHTSKKIVRIVCPNGWGKSINLKMIASFVAQRFASSSAPIPVKKTENYRLFVRGELMDMKTNTLHKLENPLEISKHNKTIEKFLAKYPIILVDFSTFKPKTYTYREFFNYFQKLVADLYTLYSFMVRRIKIFTKEMESSKLTIIDDGSAPLIKQFKLYKFQKEFNETKMARSIRFLCTLLHIHYNKQSFVFFDEYDKVINSLYTNKQYHEDTVKKISDFYYYIMKQTLIMNRNFEKAIVTGVLNVEMGEERMDHGDILNRYLYMPGMYPQYGFTKDQVDQLFALYAVPANLRPEVDQWYGGYKLYDRNETVYTSRSIVKFLNQKAFDNYRPLDENLDLFAHMILHEDIKNAFQTVINGKSIMLFHCKENFNYTDLIALKRSVWGGPISDPSARLELSLQYLYALGYLTLEGISDYNEFKLKIPNREVDGIWRELISNNTPNPES